MGGKIRCRCVEHVLKTDSHVFFLLGAICSWNEPCKIVCFCGKELTDVCRVFATTPRRGRSGRATKASKSRQKTCTVSWPCLQVQSASLPPPSPPSPRVARPRAVHAHDRSIFYRTVRRVQSCLGSRNLRERSVGMEVGVCLGSAWWHRRGRPGFLNRAGAGAAKNSAASSGLAWVCPPHCGSGMRPNGGGNRFGVVAGERRATSNGSEFTGTPRR